MPTAAETAASNVYAEIIQEVLVRVHSAQMLISIPLPIPPPLIRESVYLQIRICCELIALGCLVCHSDIKAAQTKAIQKSYAPKEILDKLQSLHQDFFPVPGTLTRAGNGFDFVDYDHPHLTKSELITLWAKSGNYLHKGNLRSLLKSVPMVRAPVSKYDDLVATLQKIINLVTTHRIASLNKERHFFVVTQIDGWGKPPTTINVSVAIAESPPGPAPISEPHTGRSS